MLCLSRFVLRCPHLLLQLVVLFFARIATHRIPVLFTHFKTLALQAEIRLYVVCTLRELNV
jgi:hypothetical protein